MHLKREQQLHRAANLHGFQPGHHLRGLLLRGDLAVLLETLRRFLVP